MKITVQELIDILKQFDPEIEVLANDDDEYGQLEIQDIKESTKWKTDIPVVELVV